MSCQVHKTHIALASQENNSIHSWNQVQPFTEHKYSTIFVCLYKQSTTENETKNAENDQTEDDLS